MSIYYGEFELGEAIQKKTGSTTTVKLNKNKILVRQYDKGVKKFKTLKKLLTYYGLKLVNGGFYPTT